MAIKFIGNPKDVIYNKALLTSLFAELKRISDILQGINEGAFANMDPEVLKEEKEAFNYRQQYLTDQILDYMFLPRDIINEYGDIHEMMDNLFGVPYWISSPEYKVEKYINYITKQHYCSICGSEVSIGDKYCSACTNEEDNRATKVFNYIANSIRNLANPCGEIAATVGNSTHRISRELIEAFSWGYTEEETIRELERSLGDSRPVGEPLNDFQSAYETSLGDTVLTVELTEEDYEELMRHTRNLEANDIYET